MTKQKYCDGCHNDIYNHGENKCWMIKTAKVVKRKMVHVDQVPPWTQKPIKTLNCYNRPRFVMVDANRTN